MAEELKIVLAVDGADKVAAALDNTSEALKDTADEAKKAGDALNKTLKPAANNTGATLTNLNRVVSDAPFGFIGIANNLQPLVESFQRLQAESKNSGGALKALVSSLSGPAGLALGFSAVSTAITFAQVGLTYWRKKTKEVEDANEAFQKSLTSVEQSASTTGVKLRGLIAIAKDESQSYATRNEALDKANKIMGDYGQKLTLANIKTKEITDQTNLFTQALINEAIAAKYADRVAELTIQETQAKKDLLNAENTLLQQKKISANEQVNLNTGLTKSSGAVTAAQNMVTSAQAKLNLISKQLVETTDALNNSQKSAAINFGLVGKKADEQKKKTEKAKKELESFDTVIRKTLEGLRDQEQVAIAIDQSTIDDQIKIVKDTINKAIKEYNLPSNDQRVIVLSAILDELEATKAAEEGAKNIKKNIETKPQFRIKQKIVPEIATDGVDVKKLEDDLTKILSQTMINVGVNIGETLGNVLTGAAKFGDVFKGIFQTLANGVKAMGEQLIQVGVLALAAKVSLSQLFANPAASIAVGIALVALGQALSNLSTNKFAVGTNFAPGGMALVGERGPELVNLPRGSQVVPAAQTSAMLGGRQNVEVFGVLRGQDIYFSNKRYGQTYNRQT